MPKENYRFLVFTLLLLAANSVYQINSGFGNWEVEFAGVKLKNYADPGGAYIEGGVHFLREKEGVFPGHPGMLTRITVKIVASVVHLFSQADYYESAVDNYLQIAVSTKILQSSIFILMLASVAWTIGIGLSGLALVILVLTIQPYFWIYFDAIAPELVLLSGVAILISGVLRSNRMAGIAGILLIGTSKFMFFPLFIFLLWAISRRTLLIGLIAIVAVYGLYFTQASLSEFKNIWFLFSPAGLPGGENALTHNIVNDLLLSVQNYVLFFFKNLKYLVLSPQEFLGIWSLNVPFIFTFSGLLYLHKVSSKRNLVYGLWACFILTALLYLFRVEGHYLLPTFLAVLIALIHYLRVENKQSRVPRFAVPMVLVIWLLGLPNVVQYHKNNIQHSQEFRALYLDKDSFEVQKQCIQERGVNHYYPYQFGYTTAGKVMPMYEEILRQYRIKGD